MKNLKFNFIKEKRINQNVSSWYLRHFQTLFSHIDNSQFLDLKNIKSFNLENSIKFFQEKSKNWSPESYNFYRKIYLVFLKYLVREFQIEDFSKNLITKKTAKSLPKFFTEKEIKTILKRLNKEEKQIVLFFLYSWIRKNEFLNLKKSDIQNWIIRIKNWKGRKERLIPIHNNLDISFLNFPYSLDFLNHLYKKIKSKKKKFKWHNLRHTFATKLINNWADIYVISQLLWHSDINTTTIYLSCNISQKKEKINLLNFNF